MFIERGEIQVNVKFGWRDNGDIFLKTLALPGVAQWVEHQPANQKVTSWIPSQGT